MGSKRKSAAAPIVFAIGILALAVLPILLIGGYLLRRPEPMRLDGTSEATFKASVERMLVGRSEREIHELRVSFALAGGEAKSEDEFIEQIRIEMDGKTFSEAVAEGEALMQKYGKEKAQLILDQSWNEEQPSRGP